MASPVVHWEIGGRYFDATLAKVGELGGVVLVPPTSIPGLGAFALFREPEGNTIGLLRSTA